MNMNKSDKRMATVAFVCIAVGALVLLTACGAKETVIIREVPKETTPDTIPTYEPMSDGEIFVETVEGAYPGTASTLGGKSELIKFGNLVCAAIDEGNTLYDFANMAVDNNVDPEMLGFIIGAAIPAFCPENSWFLQQYLTN